MKTILSRLFKDFNASGSTPTPHLTRRPEFEALLSDYHPSPETIAILAKTPLVTLTAPSATGRNTIINALVKTGRYRFIISDTTRPPRMNGKKWERDGIEYFFRNEDDMLDDIKAGRFVEAEVFARQQVSGTSAREVERAYQNGQIPINDVDIEGGINIAKLKPDAITLCVLPPSFDAWISRIRGRSDFKPEEFHRRLQQATKIFRLALAHSHFIFVINDNLHDAIQAVDDIASRGVHHAQDEKQAHDLAMQLYEQTVAYLREHAPDVRPA